MDIKKIKACYNEVTKNFNRIDILINAAGGNIKRATTYEEQGTYFFDLPLSAFEEVVGFNLFGGSILPCRLFGRCMAKTRREALL